MKKGLALFSIPLFLLLDQWTKYLASTHWKENPVILIPKVLEFQYLENTGTAWGLFQNGIPFFLVSTILILFLCFWIYFHLPKKKRFLPIQWVILLLISGALGNMIDRIFRGYVVDFIYFSLINFPIFNVADMYVCISMGAIILLILFYYKEEEMNAIFSFPWKKKEGKS